MNTERYRTGLKRLWAAIVDWIVFLPLLLVAKWIYQTTDNISILFAWQIFVAFVPLIYSVTSHYKYGQTIGKWVAGVKVLDVGEARSLNFAQAVYRDSFYLLVAAVGLVYHSFLFTRTEDTIGVLNDYSSFGDNPLLWWALIELTTMLTNSRRRAVHDFLARTVVVRTETSS